MKIFEIKKWRYIDQSTLGAYFSPIQSFAIDDTLCSSVAEKDGMETVRTWVHHDTIVLGIQDSRLPNVKAGIDYLNNQGYKTIIRNSGGLAVVLDEEILNISLIFKEDRQISINSGYDAMYELVQEMFHDETTTIEAKEIVGSYCPGSYDLSINGKKFAGISQRRVRGGVAVQIYLCMGGSGSDRAALIKDFYKIAVNNSQTKFNYPTIIPETMASLSELLQKPLSVQMGTLRLLQALQQGRGSVIQSSQLTTDELVSLEHHLQRMQKRNEQLNLENN